MSAAANVGTADLGQDGPTPYSSMTRMQPPGYEDKLRDPVGAPLTGVTFARDVRDGRRIETRRYA